MTSPELDENVLIFINSSMMVRQCSCRAYPNIPIGKAFQERILGLLLPIYGITTVMGIIEWNEFHAILCLEVLDALQALILRFLYCRCRYLEIKSIVVIILLRVTERMLHLVKLACHHDRSIDQCHLGGIVLGCLLSELHSQLYFYLITSLQSREIAT